MGIQQYYIDKKLKKALEKSTKTKTGSLLSKIDKIAIFVDDTSVFIESEFKILQEILKLDNSHFSILTFKTKKTSFNEFRGTVVLERDINWKGKITSKDVLAFLNKDYDLLIDYTQANTQTKQLIISEIKALLKIGFKVEKEEFYDIMIDVKSTEVSLFNKEIGHYFSILQLI